MAKSMSDDALLERLIEVFQNHGYVGASMSIISDATGLGRASLYHRYPGGKREMATAVLAQARAHLEADALEALTSDRPPREKLDEMMRRVAAFYQGRSCLLDVLSLGDTDPELKGMIESTMKAWIEAIAGTLEESGMPSDEAHARAEDVVVRIQGALVVARTLGNRSAFDRVVRLVGAEALSDPAA